MEGLRLEPSVAVDDSKVSCRFLVKPHPTLRFHRRFGKNIRVDESRSVALRTDDFQHGIVFTSRPVELNEIVSVILD